MGKVQLDDIKQMAKEVGKLKEENSRSTNYLLTDLFYLYCDLPLNGVREGCEQRENRVKMELE